MNGSGWSGVLFLMHASKSGLTPCDNTLSGVTVLSPENAWAVGGSDTCLGNGGCSIEEGVIEHYDGTAWKIAEKLNGGTYLTAIAAMVPNNIWAVGWYDTYDLIVHYDGSTWQISK